MHAPFTFRRLERADFARLAEWLGHPHVAAWWGHPPDVEDVAREYGPHLASDVVWPFVASLDGAPVGFAQAYDVMRADPAWWRDETDPGARGIDLFLADPSLLGRGLGAAMIRSFVATLFADPAVTKVQADPSPRNIRAIRAFERAGFRRIGEVKTPDGDALLLVLHRSG